jgi:glycosyltransferase involved in cell wall biosynthesis
MTDRVLVVVPAYNEAACVGDVVRSVRASGYDCLVVDDASGDDTSELAREAGAMVVELPINLGVGGALRAGWKYAAVHGYDTVVQIDADGQHPASNIAVLLDTLATGRFDLVVGSRFAAGGAHAGMSRVRRAAIRLLSSVLRRSAGVAVTDPTSGLRAVTGPLLRGFAADFPHHYLGDTFEALLVAGRRGYRIGEVPAVMLARQGGTPSADGYASVRAMVRALTVLLTGTTFDVPPAPPAARTPG